MGGLGRGAPDEEHDFRRVLGHFSTGVTVVTSVDQQEPVGLTIQAFCSLSLDPPLILVCPARTSVTWPRVEKAGVLCVNVLAEHQANVAKQFARSGTEKFAGIRWARSQVTGSPVIDDSMAWIDCRIQEVREGGDHFIAICHALALGARTDVRPLIFFKSGFERVRSPQELSQLGGYLETWD